MIALSVIIILIMFFGSPKSPSTDSWKWIISLGFLLVAINFKFGIYVYIQEGYIYRVQEFFVRRKLKVQEIQGIFYKPTFIVGKINRSIYIVADPNDSSKIIEMSNTGFDRKTLIRVVTDLKTMNPSIKLDEYTKSLLAEGTINHGT